MPVILNSFWRRDSSSTVIYPDRPLSFFHIMENCCTRFYTNKLNSGNWSKVTFVHHLRVMTIKKIKIIWRYSPINIKQIIVTRVKRHLSYAPSKYHRLGDFSSWRIHERAGRIYIRASTSIMRRLVEDVTGKKIEHLIKKALSARTFPPSECAISSVHRTACRIPAAFRAAYFRKSAFPTPLIRVRNRTRSDTG